MKKRGRRPAGQMLLTALNPVTAAVERAGNRRVSQQIRLEMYMLAEGEECRSLLTGAGRAIIAAIAALEGSGDPDGIGDELLIACDLVVQAAKRGYTWRKQDAVTLEAALASSIEIFELVPRREQIQAATFGTGLTMEMLAAA